MSTIWNFTANSSSVIKTLQDSDPPREQSFKALSLRMVNNFIYLYEAGIEASGIAFEQIGTIDGVAPTDLQDAESKLLALIPVNGSSSLSLITDLKPIIIYDPNEEYFNDSTSALDTLTNFNLPNPSNSYYNSNSKEFYVWYSRGNLEDLFVSLNFYNGIAFGVDSNVSIQDESGFIYGFAGDAFNGNNKSQYSNSNKLKVLYAPDDNILTNTHSDFEIEQCYVNGANFGVNAVGNVYIKYAQFNSTNVFAGASPTNDNIIRIGFLDYVGGINFANGFGGKFVIDAIGTELLSSCPSDMFNTESPAILHLPFYAKGTNFGNYAEANIKATVSTNQVVYDGLVETVSIQPYVRIFDLSASKYSDVSTFLSWISTYTDSTLLRNVIVQNGIAQFECDAGADFTLTDGFLSSDNGEDSIFLEDKWGLINGVGNNFMYGNNNDFEWGTNAASPEFLTGNGSFSRDAQDLNVFTGNITIKCRNTVFFGNGCFVNANPVNQIIVESIDGIGSNFAENINGTFYFSKFPIGGSVDFPTDIFTTSNLALVIVPYVSKFANAGSVDGDVLNIITNISSNPNSVVSYDGIKDATIQEYIAIYDQIGTNAPTLSTGGLFKNEISNTVTLTRLGVGVYNVVIDGFDSSIYNFICECTPQNSASANHLGYFDISVSATGYDLAYSFFDGTLFDLGTLRAFSLKITKKI